MAVGDTNDIYNRLIQNMPGWYGGNPDANGNNSNHPNLDSLLQAYVSTYNYHYNQQFMYALLQERIQTATDINLDLISKDYLGDILPRLQNENDDTYRKRILANVIQIKATKPAMANALYILTGYQPIIYEGWNVNDSMALGDGSSNPLTDNPIFIGGLSYIDNLGVQHVYGKEALGSMSSGYFPYRFAIIVFLPANQGLGQFPGLNNPDTVPPNPYFGLGYNWYLGSQSMVTQVITVEMIKQTIELTKTLGTELATSPITGEPDLTIIYINV